MSAPRLTAAWRAGSSTGLAGWRVQFPFNQEAIDVLKARIPPEAREWDPENKTWWIAIEWEAALERIIPNLAAYRSQQPMF